MVDFHSHLFFPAFDADREATGRRAWEAGIRLLLSVGTDPETNRQAVSLASEDSRVYASVGLHPHFFDEHPEQGTDDGLQALERGLRALVEGDRDNVRAIGECGLDYFSRDPERPVGAERKALQERGFRMQLSLARELGLPVIIHCRTSSPETGDAYEAVRAILEEELSAEEVRARVMHCYMGDVEVTGRLLALPHVFFSFAGNVTYPPKASVAGTGRDPGTVLQLVPPERLLTETDCPFLPPSPHRGKRNEPAYVAETLRHIARAKGMEPGLLEGQVENNARQALGLV